MKGKASDKKWEIKKGLKTTINSIDARLTACPESDCMLKIKKTKNKTVKLKIKAMNHLIDIAALLRHLLALSFEATVNSVGSTLLQKT